MKPVKKDGKRQARRERTLARLEATLKGGVKTVKPFGAEVATKLGPLTPEQIDRMLNEVFVLKTRLGKV